MKKKKFKNKEFLFLDGYKMDCKYYTKIRLTIKLLKLYLNLYLSFELKMKVIDFKSFKVVANFT